MLYSTTPRRTAADIALHVTEPAGDAALLALLGGSPGHCEPELVLRDLETMPKTPGRRAALARVRKITRSIRSAGGAG